MSNQVMASTNQWTRVVVLTPAASFNGGSGVSSGLSPELKAIFSARDWFAVEQNDPNLAMAELCLRERAQTARAAWGLQRMEQLALVVLEPQKWLQLDELATAVRTYIRCATIWTVAENEVIPLGAPIVQTGQQTESEQGSVHPMVIGLSKAPGHRGSILKHAAPDMPDERLEDSQQISRQEIEMLLRVDSSEGAA